MVKSEDLLNLTTKQLKDIIDKIKKVLNLTIAGKNKEELVKTIMNLHKKNKFMGKKLLSFDDSSHIKVPSRKIAEPDIKKIQKKKDKIKQLKEEKEKKKLELFLKTPEGRLSKLMEELPNIKSTAESEVLRAKIRKLKKDINK